MALGDASHLNDPAQVPRCTKRRVDKQPCRARAVHGTNPPACRKHCGKSLEKIRAEVAIREAVLKWGLGDTKVDPGELLLRLVTQSAIRAEAYASELARIVAEKESLEKALTDDSWTVTADGQAVKTGEYVRAMARLEAEERDRAAGFAIKAVAAGLAERQVRLAEAQGALLATVIRAILDDLDLTADQRDRALEVVPRHLRAVA